MAPKILLKWWYMGIDVQSVISDVDKVNLIDLVIEYLEKTEEKGIEHPRNPTFAYVNNMKHWDLNSDADLMKMFESLKGRDEIFIWVGSVLQPNALMKAVHTLRASQKAQKDHNPASFVPEHPPSPPAVIIEEPRPKKLTPRRSARLMSVRESDEEGQVRVELAFANDGGYNNIDLDETLVDKIRDRATARIRGRGRGRGRPPLNRKDKGKGKMYPDVEILGSEVVPGSETEIFDKPKHNTPAIHSPQLTQSPALPNLNDDSEVEPTPVAEPPLTADTLTLSTPTITCQPKAQTFLVRHVNPEFTLKRIPRTTALRKGLPLTEPPIHNQKLSRRLRSNTVSLGDDLDNEVSELDEDEDESYQPDDSVYGDGDNEEGTDDDVSLCSEDQDESDEDLSMMVRDDFDPYDENQWEDDKGDDGSYLARLYRNGEMYNEMEFGKIQLKQWHIFLDKQHLRDVLRDYCVQSGFSVVVLRANNEKYTAVCSAKNCGWRLHASILPDGVTWAIKSIKNSEHTCIGLDSNNPMVNTKWATRVLLEDIRANNDIPAKALNELLFQRFGVQMKPSTLYKVRKTALMEIHGGFDVSYSLLPNYCEVIKSINPGSTAQCSWNPPEHPERPLGFNSIFISFKGVLDGVIGGCRSLVGVDGAHLKGNYGGVLLSAIAVDANNEIIPFAWAIVAGEDEYAWKFFIYYLKQILKDSGRGDEWCIMSDRQKGINKAIEELWPTVDRRYCYKHLSKNFKSKFPGPLLLSLFWKASGAYSPFTFKKAMQQLQKTNHLALLWLAEIGPQSTWTKHKFNPVVKCDFTKNNFVESFNATLGIDRCRPVLTLLEGVRRVTMVRMATRRQRCEDWDREDLCPNIVRRLKVLSNESRTCVAYPSGEGEYEIQDGRSKLHVSLNNSTCKCGQWQLSGIPCRHGMRAIHHARLDPHTFVNGWYSMDMYKVTYGGSIKPIPDEEQWPDTTLPSLEPPAFRRGIGRPSRNRRREEGEQGKCKRSKTVKCSICKEYGHNSLTCRGGLTAKQKKSNQSKGKKKKADDRASTSKAGQPKTKKLKSATQPQPTVNNKASTSKRGKKGTLSQP